MKYVIIIVLILLGLESRSSNLPFSVLFELINPTGSLDERSYFQLSVTNETDSTYAVFCGLALAIDFSWVEVEVEMKDGAIDTLKVLGFPTFDFDGASKIVGPHEVCKVKSELFLDGMYGVIPKKKEYIDKIKRVRLNIRKLRYVNMTKKKSEGKINDFHSNWLEIDGEAFKKLL